MLGQKNSIIVDRKLYTFKGKWENPQQDLHDNIFYFISQPATLTTEWKNGREELVQVLEITCYGEHPFAINDVITLQNGEKFRVESIINNYFEANIAVRDMLKQRIESQVLTIR